MYEAGVRILVGVVGSSNLHKSPFHFFYYRNSVYWNLAPYSLKILLKPVWSKLQNRPQGDINVYTIEQWNWSWMLGYIYRISQSETKNEKKEYVNSRVVKLILNAMMIDRPFHWIHIPNVPIRNKEWKTNQNLYCFTIWSAVLSYAAI